MEILFGTAGTNLQFLDGFSVSFEFIQAFRLAIQYLALQLQQVFALHNELVIRPCKSKTESSDREGLGG